VDISVSKKRLIVAYWMSDYCQNGSRSWRMLKIHRDLKQKKFEKLLLVENRQI